MSEILCIYDAMLEMHGSAIEAGKKPRRWEINEAGLSALNMDPRVTAIDRGQKSLLELPFFGTPLAMMSPAAKRFDPDPKVFLVVDERYVREPAYTEFELGERQALLEVRSFITKHGKREVDAYCAQRLHDLRMDALARAKKGRI